MKGFNAELRVGMMPENKFCTIYLFNLKGEYFAQRNFLCAQLPMIADIKGPRVFPFPRAINNSNVTYGTLETRNVSA